MNSWQKQRRNTDFLLRCMMIKRGSVLTKENLERLSSMIDKEEQEMIKHDELGLRGSFHKGILYNLSNDSRVKDYLEELEETDCRVSLDKQLGVLEALRDYFGLSDVNDICSVCGEEKKDCLSRTKEESNDEKRRVSK